MGEAEVDGNLLPSQKDLRDSTSRLPRPTPDLEISFVDTKSRGHGASCSQTGQC